MVEVVYFAWVRERIGLPRERVETGAATVAGLVAELAAREPRYAAAFADPETFAATWADFRPAMPVTVDGAITAGIGFVGGWGAVKLLLALLLWPFRRRRLA